MSVLETNWQHKYINTNGIKLHYVTQGEGKLMLMLHGFPEFWYSWRHQIVEFSQNYKVVALDLRGYNDSEKPQEISAYSLQELVKDIKGVITGLGYESCILIGHDWGGGIAWNFAYSYPEMVGKLITLNMPHPAKLLEGLKTPKQLLRSWYIFFFQLPIIPELVYQWNDYQVIASLFTDMAIDKAAFTSEDIEIYKNAAAKRGVATATINYYRSVFPTLLNQEQNWGILDISTLMI